MLQLELQSTNHGVHRENTEVAEGYGIFNRDL